jgi:hypothetical protein
MKNASTPGFGRDFTDEQIRSYVGDLESLRGGELTVSLLVGCGERAIAPLREYLLYGRPRGIFQPRQRAVEALAELGAKDVLLEYLSQQRNIPDAEVRFGEEAVENTAARSLGQWRTEEVFDFLKELAQRRMLAGVIEALGTFERVDAVDTFVRALGDDVCRPAADEALCRIAGKVKPVLMRAALRNSGEAEEKPSERRRRCGVVKILSEMPFTTEEWNELRPLLGDLDKEIALAAAEIATDCAPMEEKQEAARVLIRSFAKAHWFTQARIQDCLRRNYDAVREVIAEERASRQRCARAAPMADHVFRVLTKMQITRKPSDSPERESHGKREDTAGRG